MYTVHLPGSEGIVNVRDKLIPGVGGDGDIGAPYDARLSLNDVGQEIVDHATVISQSRHAEHLVGHINHGQLGQQKISHVIKVS